MDTQTLRSFEVVGYYSVALLAAVIIGHLLVGLAYRITLKAYNQEELRDTSGLNLSALIGDGERVLYILSILLGRPEFIGVWLLLKVVGEWSPPQVEGRRTAGVAKEYKITLIGNVYSLIVGVLFGYLIKTLLPPFPVFAPIPLPLTSIFIHLPSS